MEDKVDECLQRLEEIGEELDELAERLKDIDFGDESDD